MNKNIFKKVIVIVLVFISFVIIGSNNVFAEDSVVDPVVPPAKEDPVVVTPNDVLIHLNITSGGSSLYNQDISVKACDSDNNASTPPTVSAYCAVLQSGIPSVWDWTWAPGAFVTSLNNIAGYTSKDKENKDVYHYWSWSSNGTPGMEGLNQYVVNLNDQILLEFIDPVETITIPVVTAPMSNGGGSKGGTMVGTETVETTEKTFSIEKALSYLLENQNKDGSFNSPIYTDWAAVASVAAENKLLQENISNYFKINLFESNILTENERHAMALMALNINPYNGTNINYIKKIVDSFDGTQFGDKTQVNDDIFALIVLKNAGYTINDEIIAKDIKFIISNQSLDGEWGSIDMTPAGIEALRGFEDILGVKDSVLKAKNFLIANQKTDSGFENSFTTSWVLQSLFDDNNILKGEAYLIGKQQTDGGLENITEDKNTRIWATSYAIPAVLHKTWGSILNNFSKVAPENIKNEDKKTLNKGEIIKKRITTNIVLPLNEEISAKENTPIEKEVLISTKVGFWNKVKTPFVWLLDKLGF
jgi:hypothetical protein